MVIDHSKWTLVNCCHCHVTTAALSHSGPRPQQMNTRYTSLSSLAVHIAHPRHLPVLTCSPYCTRAVLRLAALVSRDRFFNLFHLTFWYSPEYVQYLLLSLFTAFIPSFLFIFFSFSSSFPSLLYSSCKFFFFSNLLLFTISFCSSFSSFLFFMFSIGFCYVFTFLHFFCPLYDINKISLCTHRAILRYDLSSMRERRSPINYSLILRFHFISDFFARFLLNPLSSVSFFCLVLSFLFSFSLVPLFIFLSSFPFFYHIFRCALASL